MELKTEDGWTISASPYALKVFGMMADELLAYEKDHPEKTRKECMDDLWGDAEWVEMRV